MFNEDRLLWNRTQYFALLAQAILVAKYVKENSDAQVITAFCSALIVSLAVFSYFISSSGADPLIPYQNYVEYLIDGEKGTGRKRAEDYANLAHFKLCKSIENDSAS